MARVALVNLPFQGRIASVAQTSVGPPMGLAHVGAVLEAAGHSVRIVDANAVPMDLDRIVEQLAGWQPGVVGTTAATPSIGLAAELAGRVGERLGVPFVVGGPHPAALPRETLADYPAIDVAVSGEGEAIADPLVRALTGEGGLSEVPGIAHRAAGQPTLTSPAPVVADLDALPWPARHLLPNRRYRTVDASPMTCIIAMRGCPARCTYCNVPGLAGGRMRRRSADDVVAEMEQVLTRWGVRFVSFLDDTFTTSRRWVIQLCEALRAAGLPGRMSWSCLTRPDLVDEELLAAMRDAGMIRIEFGIESGAPRVLERLGKGVDLPRIRAAFQMTRRAGLVTMGFAMINTPEETPEELEQTAAEVMRIDPDFLQLSFCTPYPGTGLYRFCEEHDLLRTRDWADYRFLRTPVIRNRWLTSDQLRARHAAILRRFYLRPGKAARLARLAATRPSAARSLAGTAARGLFHLVRRRDG